MPGYPPPERVEILRLIRPFLERIRADHPTAGYAFKYHAGIIELLEIRNDGDREDLPNPYCFALAIYESRDDSWELYCMRGLEKSKPCQLILAPTLDAVLELVEEDAHFRFFG